ncbi:DegV family protein [Fusibacter ferrireducens]|uniref:DegV family protein n=1 Tax=Fusibacter ferrireducens TaxID=2785058 RepID=A0ABR9ZXC6_9FIRM|nr:DegV family protein [Fusibacter ferrireducens]MBF4694803.1 DegV family protein [Fusibacter ferrireducens]
MYKVIADSSNEIDQAFLDRYPVDIVPFKLYIDGVEYVDDASLDVDQFVDNMVKASALPKSACPSPNDFMAHFEGEEDEIYVVAISSRLSGTYNSAMLAKKIYEGENPGKKFIHVFDSLGAAATETLITRKIHEVKKQNVSPKELVKIVERYIDETHVYFISESLDNLIKNGRISKWKGIIASTLKILPIMGATERGEIKLCEKVRTSNKAYQRLIEILQEEILKNGKKIVAVTHVGNFERANQIVDALSQTPGVEEIFNLKCAGLSSLYADNNGVIVAL